MYNNILNIVMNFTATIKFVILSVASFLTGSTFVEGYMLLFFQDLDSNTFTSANWLPAFLGGVGGLIVVIIGQISSHILSMRAERDKDARKKQEERDSQHLTFTDKIAELQQERDEKFLEELKDFHEDKIAFKNIIIKDLKISEYASRQREHLAINEVNRLWAHIHLCHAKMKVNNIDIPEMSFKNNDDIMEGLEERVAKYIQTLEKE